MILMVEVLPSNGFTFGSPNEWPFAWTLGWEEATENVIPNENRSSPICCIPKKQDSQLASLCRSSL